MRRLSGFLTTVALIAGMVGCGDGSVGEEAVTFADRNLEAEIREAIAIPQGPIYPSDLEGLSSLNATQRNIADLTGVEYCTSLTELDLSHNYYISDISALANLTHLTELCLHSNEIGDISALAHLTNLTELLLGYNRIGDVSPLADLTNLAVLSLQVNQISDISSLANLTNLTELYLASNQITDISALSGLVSLTSLYLAYNQISDIQPLVNNPSLSEGDYVDLLDNPLSVNSIDICIPELQARGVTVHYWNGGS